MSGIQVLRGLSGALLITLLAAAPSVQAQSAEYKFYQAYYLEHADGDVAAAARVYEQVASDRRADSELRAKAKSSGEACQEELATTDFAALVPPNTLVYAELNRPGAQLNQLLQMLGLLREDGSFADDSQHKFAISPELARELLGVRGAAVALTGFDMAAEKPAGVAILHPGNIAVIRGLIETALPAAAAPVESIEGFPTYNIEDEVFVTVTRRLVLVSTQREEIENVIWRLKGEETESLASNPQLADVVRDRGDGLLFFCVNFQPVLPLLNAGMAAAGTQSQELAMAQALLDLNSLRTLTGHMGVNDQGLFLDVTLRLDEENRNLVFQFLRMPAIDRDTLRGIPAGVAGFMAGALNEAEHIERLALPPTAENQPMTMLDIGREIFANVISFAIFAVPDAGEMAGEQPIPGAAAIVTVHDPARSTALWGEMLGVASLASGGGTLDGMKTDIDGVETRRYVFPEGVSVYFASVGNDMLISPSKKAIARSIATLRGGKSIVDDPAFAGGLKRMGENATFALFAHPGRCIDMARPFMNPNELKEVEPIIELMTDTVASLVMEHSKDTFRFNATVTGLPDIGPFVTRMIEQERTREARGRQLRKAKARGDWDKALDIIRSAREQNPENVDLVWKEFKILAAGKGDREAAASVGKQLLKALHEDATSLNNYAWALLTEDDFAGKYDELALKMSQRSNELTSHKKWMFIDTLGLALFKTGDVDAAIETQKKAVALCGESPRREEVEAALHKFEAAVEQ